MAVIFVWHPKGGNVGHASMALDSGAYVSWWPHGTVSKVGTATKDAASSGIKLDKQAEGGPPHYASAPITGLDENAMASHWSKLSGRLAGREPHSTAQEMRPIPNGQYDIFSKSCAGAVLDTLVVGKMFAAYPLTQAILANAAIVTPLLLEDLAEAMTGDMGNKILSVLRSPSRPLWYLWSR